MPDHLIIQTARLTLVGAAASLLRAELEDKTRFAETLGARVPDAWPPEHYDENAIRYSLRMAEDPACVDVWLSWYFLLNGAPPTLIGMGGFKGAPDEARRVDIGYSILPAYRGHGYATEATVALVDWAYRHGAAQVIGETLPELKASIRVLEKAGFGFAGHGDEPGVIRFEHRRVQTG